MSSIEIAAAGERRTRTRPDGTMVKAVLRTVRRDRWLIVVAMLQLSIAFLVASLVGAAPDFAYLWAFGIWIVALLVVGAVAAFIVKFVHLAVVERSNSPVRELGQVVYRFMSERDRLVAFLVTFVCYLMFLGAFSVLKPDIPKLNPFSWDMAFTELDRMVHFGVLPHEWLMPMLGSAGALFVLNFFYGIWFLLVIAGMLAAAAMVRDAELRLQYLMTLFATYFLGGIVVATLFSSAGPCFHLQLGLGETYSGLMASLRSANEVHPILALQIQDTLWAGYAGERAGSVGISAFPSMHVATAVLMALGAYRINRTFGMVMWAYAFIIQIGSVMLAWHYAVDGYAGALIVLAVWKASGIWARRAVRETQKPELNALPA